MSVVDTDDLENIKALQDRIRKAASDRVVAEIYARRNLFILVCVGLTYAIGTQLWLRTGTAPHAFKLHWLTISATCAVILPFVGCGLELSKDHSKPGSYFLPFTWKQLLGLDNKKFNIVSNYSVAIMPIFAYVTSHSIFQKYFPNISLPTLNMKISFFAALFFTLAPIAVAVLSPPNPSIGKETADDAAAIAIIEYDNERRFTWRRGICSSLYFVGIVFLMILLVRVALFVAYSGYSGEISTPDKPALTNVQLLLRDVASSSPDHSG